MIKHIYTTTYILFLTIAFSSCNSNNPQKMETTENTTVDSTSTTTNSDSTTTPVDSVVTKEDTTTTPEKVVNVPLKVIVDNLSTNEGEIEIGVYTPQNKFPDEKDKFKKYRFKPENMKLEIELTDLKYGEYAFAIYHDENNNGKIDKNMIGIPTEPYAFSNNYKPTIKAPSFDNCKFTYSKESHEVRISLINKKKK